MKRPELPSRRIVNDLGKSEIVVTPTGLGIVEELASRGCSVVTISAALGVNKETFVHMRRRDPAVEEAFERGRAKEHDRLVSNLNTGGVLLLPAEVTVEQYLAQKRADGDMIDVTPPYLPTIYPGHAPLPEALPVSHQTQTAPDPAPSRPAPSGTTIAPFPPRTTRGD